MLTPSPSFTLQDNILSHGGVANDTGVDNGIILQNLLNNVAGTGTVICFPVGVYTFKTPVNIPSAGKVILFTECEAQASGISHAVSAMPQKIYPNPATDKISINGGGEWLELLVYDCTGHVVKSFSGNNAQIDVSGLEKGVYLLVVEGAGGRHIAKLVKM